jgi:hypothetical protein
MAPTVPTARIGDLGKEGKKAPSDGCFHATPPCNTSPETGLSLRQVLLLFSQVQTVKSPGGPAKQRDIAELRSLGVELLPGDLVEGSAADLSALFKGFHTVIGCTGFVAGRSIQIKLARAVLDAGVKRYFPWQFGVDYDAIGRGGAQDLFDEQLAVRDLLRSQDRTEWVIVSTGMFTSFLFEPSFGVVDLAQNTVHALGSWDTAVTVTTPEDIGVLTAEIAFAEPRIVNSVVYTAGDTITYGRLADVVDSVLGRKVRRVEWSVPELKDEWPRTPPTPSRSTGWCSRRAGESRGRWTGRSMPGGESRSWMSSSGHGRICSPATIYVISPRRREHISSAVGPLRQALRTACESASWVS